MVNCDHDFAKGLIVGIILMLVLAALGFLGYYLWQRKKKEQG